MPLINVRLIEGVFTPEQKQEIQKKLTDTMVSIEGENLRDYTVVIIDEVPSGQWAFGGKSFTTEGVKAVAAGKKAAA
jgi:4-oxalocrotonate tautomerase